MRKSFFYTFLIVFFVAGVVIGYQSLSRSGKLPENLFSFLPQSTTSPTTQTAQVGGGNVTPQNPIQIAFQNLAAVTRTGELVSGGIPLPQNSGITSTSNLRVVRSVSGSYVETPAQFRVLSRWFGTRNDTSKPIKWVLVSFIADATANQTVSSYYLDYPNGQSVTPQDPVSVVDDGTLVTVNTGAGIFTIRKGSFNVFDSVKVRTSGGSYADIVTPQTAAQNGFRLVDNNATVYTSRHPVTVTIEENGPVKAVVKVEGGYKPAGGGSSYLTFTVRMTFVSGRSNVQIDHMLEHEGGFSAASNFKYIKELTMEMATDLSFAKRITTESLGSFSSEAFTNESYELLVTVDPGAHDPIHEGCFSTNACDSTPANQLDNIRTTLSKGGSPLFQAGGNGQSVQSAAFSNGYVDVSEDSGAKGIALAGEYFWEESPSAVRVAGGTLRYDLLPSSSSGDGARHGPLLFLNSATGYFNCPANGCDALARQYYALNSGKWVEDTIMLYPHAGSAGQSGGAGMSEALRNPLIAFPANPAHYRITQVEDPFFVETQNWQSTAGLTENDRTALARFERWSRLSWDESVADPITITGLIYPQVAKTTTVKTGGGYGGAYHATYGEFTPASFSDSLPANNANHYDFIDGFVGGGRRYADTGRFLNEARPFVEDAAFECTIHPASPSDPQGGGQMYERNQSCFTADTTPRRSHNWIAGLVRYYEHTGDEFVRDTILQNAAFMIGNGSVPTTQLNFGIWRDWGWSIQNLVQAYLLEGDISYLNYPKNIVTVLNQWIQTCATQYGTDTRGFIPQSINATTQCYNNQSNANNDVIFMKGILAKGLAELHYWDKRRAGSEDVAVRNAFLDLAEFMRTRARVPGTGSDHPNYPTSYFPRTVVDKVCQYPQPPFNPQVYCSDINLFFNIAGTGNPVPQSGFPAGPITSLWYDPGPLVQAQDSTYPVAYAYTLTGNQDYLSFLEEIWKANIFYLQTLEGVTITPQGSAGVDPSRLAPITWRNSTYGEWDKFQAELMQSEMWPFPFFKSGLSFPGGVAPPPPPSLPSAPLNLNASAGTAGVTITWADTSTNEVSFLVERRTGASGTFSEIATVNAGVTNYLDTGTVVGLTYGYRVRASNGVGQSAYTNIASVTVPDTTPPTVSITAPTASATLSGTVTITASASDNIGVTGVQFLVDGAPFGQEDLTAPFSTSWNTVNTENGAHVVSARARDAENNIAVAPAVNVTTSNQGKPTFNGPTSTITAPLSGATVSGTISITAAAIQGTSRIANAQFLLDGNNLNALIVGPSPFTTTWNTTGVTSGLHTLGVRVTDGLGNAGLALPVSVTVNNPTVSPPTPPPPPGGGGTGGGFSGFTAPGTGGTGSSGFTAPGGSSGLPAPGELRAARATLARIRLGWVDTTELEQSYFIERSETGASSGFSEIGIIGANRTNFDDSPVQSNKSYWYRVKVSNIVQGPSAYSNVAMLPALTETTVPATPTDFSITLTSSTYPSGLRFVWNDPSAIETRIELHFSTDSNAFRKVNEFVNLTHFTYGGAGLSSATRYYYALKSCNNTVCSPFSNTATVLMPTASTQGATLPPPTPTPPPQFTAPPGPSPSATFTRTLKLGDTGTDVKSLQKCLNRNGSVVATTGTGSLGNESTYFGLLTKYALIHFQETHKAQVLTPLGLTTGTGFFGPATRAYMNTLGCTP